MRTVKPSSLQIIASKASQPGCDTCTLSSTSIRVPTIFRSSETTFSRRGDQTKGTFRILVVGESPGINEIDRPFQGSFGTLCKEFFDAVGIWQFCSFTNTVKCTPTIQGQWSAKSRKPTPAEIFSCSKQLREDIDSVKWDLIIPLGNTALSAVVPGKHGGIMSVSGSLHHLTTPHGSIPVMPLMSPAQILRSGSDNDKRRIQNDLLRIRAQLFGQAGSSDAAIEKIKAINQKVVRSRDDMATVVARFRALKPEAGYDIEANSLDSTRPDFTHLVDAIAISETEVYVFPLYHREADQYRDPDVTADEMFLCMFECLKACSLIYCHNVSYDATATFRFLMKQFGIFWEEYEKFRCTIVMYYLFDVNAEYALEKLAPSLGYGNYKDGPDEWLRENKVSKKERDFSKIPMSVLAPYNGIDAVVCFAIASFLKKRFSRNPFMSRAWEKQLGPMSHTYAEMEKDGMAIDQVHALHLATEYTRRQNEITQLFVSVPDVLKRMIELGTVPWMPGHTFADLSRCVQFGSAQKMNQIYFGTVKGKRVNKETGEVKQEESFLAGGLGIKPLGKMKATGFSLAKEVKAQYIDELNDFALKEGLAHWEGETEDTRELVYDHRMICQSYGRLSPSHPIDKVRRLYPFVLHHKHAKIGKQLSGYVKPAMGKWIAADGLHHARYKLQGTVTGRISSGIHTIPKVKETQRLFTSKYKDVPVRKGEIEFYNAEGSRVSRFYDVPVEGGHGERGDGMFVYADYAAIEVRVLASFCMDPDLIRLFAQGEDFHKETAAFVFELPIDQITKTMRTVSKTVTFGAAYLEASESLAARILKKGENYDECLARVVDFRERQAKRFPGLPAYIARVQTTFARRGIVTPFEDTQAEVEKYKPKGTNRWIVTPRGRYLPVPHDANAWNCKVWPVNWPVQSHASDMTASAVCNITKEFKRLGLRSRVVLNTHDSISTDTYPGEQYVVMSVMSHVMENPDASFRMAVRAQADFEIGPTLGDKKDVKDKGMKEGRAFDSTARIGMSA